MLSLNGLAGPLVEALIADADRLRTKVGSGAAGETLIDCGVAAAGSLEAGRRLAEVSLGGLAAVGLAPSEAIPRWPWAVAVRTEAPALACLGSQYAGWAFAEEEAQCGFAVLGSGPARALARLEPVFAELEHDEEADRAILILETEAAPSRRVADEIARTCGIPAGQVVIAMARTGSLAGSVQVSARVIEVALHKARRLEFPIARILDALGTAPLPPPHPDAVIAMGRTNDAIIYGGRVHLHVGGPAEDARFLAENLPSRMSHDYGASFEAIFRRSGEDFHAVDPMLFSPAQVVVTALESGETFRGGTLAADILESSFG